MNILGNVNGKSLRGNRSFSSKYPEIFVFKIPCSPHSVMQRIKINRETRCLVLCVCFADRCLSFCTFSFGHCVVCSATIYRFWLPLCYFQTLFLIEATIWQLKERNCKITILWILNINIKRKKLAYIYNFGRRFKNKYTDDHVTCIE
jgi:hypothetical protein